MTNLKLNRNCIEFIFGLPHIYCRIKTAPTSQFDDCVATLASKVAFFEFLEEAVVISSWGASAKTLRISTQALVFPAAEYYASVWSRSPHVK